MGLQTQVILPGHSTAAEIAALLESSGDVRVQGFRSMRQPEHVLFELETDRGDVFVAEAFLQSWAAPDYATVYAGPSTFLTMEHSAMAISLLQKLVTDCGHFRPNDLADWQPASALNI